MVANTESQNDKAEKFVSDCLSQRIDDDVWETAKAQCARMYTTACVVASKLNLHSDPTVKELAKLTRQRPRVYLETDVPIYAARCLATLSLTDSQETIAGQALGRASDFFYDRSKNARFGAETNAHNDLIRAYILREIRADITSLPEDVGSYQRLDIEVRTHPSIKELMPLDFPYLRFYGESRETWEQLLKTTGVESI